MQNYQFYSTVLKRTRTELTVYPTVVHVSNREDWNPNFSDRGLQKILYEFGFGLSLRMLPFTMVYFTGCPSEKVCSTNGIFFHQKFSWKSAPGSSSMVYLLHEIETVVEI